MSGEPDNLLPGSVSEHPTTIREELYTTIQDRKPILVAPPPYQENQECKL